MVVVRHPCGVPSVCTNHTHSTCVYNTVRESRTCAKAAMPRGIRVRWSPSTPTWRALIDWSFIFLTGWRPATSQETERRGFEGKKAKKRKELEVEEKRERRNTGEQRILKKAKDRRTNIRSYYDN